MYEEVPLTSPLPLVPGDCTLLGGVSIVKVSYQASNVEMQVCCPSDAFKDPMLIRVVARIETGWELGLDNYVRPSLPPPLRL